MYYHGTSNVAIATELLPPSITGCIQEVGRKKNLNKVFFTTTFNYASIYAGRAANSYGGRKRVLRVIPVGEVICICDIPGREEYIADSAIVIESINI